MPPNGTPFSTLIVDDSTLVGKRIAAIVAESNGMASTTQVETIEEATRQMEAAVPDIVFLDVRLPDGSGFEFLEKIRVLYPLVTVIMYSNFETDFVRRRTAGRAHYYLDKSRDFGQIPSLISKIMENKRSVLQKESISSIPRAGMATKRFDGEIFPGADEALNVINNILEFSTEYSIIAKDIDGKILMWNEGARLLYGYEAREVVGKMNSSVLHTPEDVKANVPRQILDATLRDGKWEGNVNRIKRNGDRFTARVVITRRLNSFGQVIGFLLISKDISDEIRVTEELKSTQLYTRSLIESNIDALMTIDPLGIITDVNKQAEALTGYSRDELVGLPFKNYFTRPDLAAAAITLALEAGKVTNYELIAHSRNGQMTPVSCNASIFHDANGKLVGIFASARDITEQKKLERALRDQQFYTRSLFESNIDALMTTDLAGVITDVNQQMERLTGSTRDQLIGTPFNSYFTDPSRAQNGIRLVLKEGRVTDYELTARNKSGDETVVSYNAATLYDRDGKLLGVFAAARDVTDRKRFEETLQEANRLKSEFLANMSHELRTPLNGVIGFSELIIDKKVGPLNLKQEEYMNDILSSGTHLLRLINDVLDLAKVEAGRMELFPETFHVQTAIDEVESVIYSMANKKNIQLNVEISEGAQEITADKQKFKQVLYNLLSNAVKFTSDGGSVEISVMPGSDNRVFVRVKDTGIGISKEGVNHLFVPFVQLDAGISRKHEGTGLGLALTKKLVDLHHGSILVESQPHKGSTFTVILPQPISIN